MAWEERQICPNTWVWYVPEMRLPQDTVSFVCA